MVIVFSLSGQDLVGDGEAGVVVEHLDRVDRGRVALGGQTGTELLAGLDVREQFVAGELAEVCPAARVIRGGHSGSPPVGSALRGSDHQLRSRVALTSTTLRRATSLRNPVALL